MKIVYKNLIDVNTGKILIVYKTGDFDRKKFKKNQRKIGDMARFSARSKSI